MRHLLVTIALLASIPSARAGCTDEVRSPQKPRDVARINKWMAVGRTWQVVLNWETRSVADDGSEEANVILAVRDNLKHPTIGDLRSFNITPNRCDKRIEPSLSTVKLMGRDFLFVTLPTSQWGTGGSGIVSAWMYSIDEKGKLTQVFHSAYAGEFTRGPECRHLLRSYIKPYNADGSRVAWIYEAPGVEWARSKKGCDAAKVLRSESLYEWKNGCFAVEEQPNPNWDRLITKWDEKECVKGIGRVVKEAPIKPAPASLDGGAAQNHAPVPGR